MNEQPSSTAAGAMRLDDRYQLIAQAGSGGMSVVWLAFDEVLARDVAVKLLSAGMAADPAFPRRLLTEARAIATLSHPHITSVHDFGVHRAADGQWTPYLVMELLDGELLSQALRRGPLPWRHAVTVGAQLASALHAAHEHGVVHRDVTPANIMLTGTGVKVLDFGICALAGDTHNGDGGGDGDDVYGTAAYLAPERFGAAGITAASDVYAAGLVLYQCLTGHLPWPAETITEMLYAHAHLPPQPLQLPGLPRAIEEICLQCLTREPHHRPTAAELAQVLCLEAQRIEVATTRLNQPVRALPGDGGTMTAPLTAPKPRLVPPRPVLIGAATLASTLALGYALHPTGPQLAAAQPQDIAQPVVPCSVSYTISPAHDGQFDALLTVTNTGDEPATRWTVRFTQPSGQTVSGTQNGPTATQRVAAASAVATVSQQDTTVTLTSPSTLDPGASVTHTLHGRYTGQPTVIPTVMAAAFTLNGTRCDATITTIITAPAPAVTVTAASPASVAQASTPDKTRQANTSPRN
ncbi:MAG TPA: serine/threonine-protein kinase [Candidatus Limnocylindrales bacterium]|nr:serine/threonine-protein kinase [Candidatus Limnocylindrales bacterium]